MTLLAIDWSGVAVKTGQFILSFSILVVLHELGHFLPAKWFKCRVEKFYLFFNPWFSLWKLKKGDTEYGIGWVPFGGYVKISGMVDESMDKEQMKLPPQPWEFRSKPAWQRLIIMVGGVVVNIVLAIVLFIMIMWIWGEKYLPPQNVKYGMVADSLGKEVGLKDGDVIYKVNGNDIKNAMSASTEVILQEATSVTVKRDGSFVELPLPSTLTRKLNSNKAAGFTSIRFPFIVDGFLKVSSAEKAGIQKGDSIVGVDSVKTPYFNEIADYVHSQPNKKVTISLYRNNEQLSIPVTVNEDGFIGAKPLTELDKLGFDVETKHYTLLESVPIGVSACFSTLDRYMTGIKQLFTGKANPNESLGSVISIGNIYPSEWNWQQFWTLTAIFSVILAFMNILPIPALDGGHALFTLVEMISGRKPSDKFMEYAQMFGMILLLGLMAYALGLDFWRMFK
jgi:regulator of sigma E protease